VGPSGAGKSTVFQLMLRFYGAQKGAIRFDGIDISELDPVALRSAIAVVAQDPVIFSGSIAANIAYGREGASEQEIRRAADAAAASEFIEKLPTDLAAWWASAHHFVGRQRQRLAIARAILRDAPLLLLDEATSALDAENELLVQQGLANLMVGRTTMVIAHRLATIQKLKRIVVMDQGAWWRRQPWRIGAPRRALCPSRRFAVWCDRGGAMSPMRHALASPPPPLMAVVLPWWCSFPCAGF